MTAYDYFYRDALPLDRESQKDWDLFISAWDLSERVVRVYERVRAARKIWLVHPEYEIPNNKRRPEESFDLEGDEAQSLISFFDSVSREMNLNAQRICIDITGMMRPHIAFVTKLLRHRGVRKFDVIYSLPASYTNREETKFSSGDVVDVREVIGFEGINLATAREVLIVAPGFDDALLREVLSQKEKADRVQIFGLPSLQPDMYQHNVLKAYGIDTPLPEERSQQRRFASAFDPFALASELSEVLERLRSNKNDCRFYIAPLATKCQMLGAAIFFLTECEGKSVSLIYPIASAHIPGTSTGVSRAWIYTVDFALCDALTARALKN